jgi:hypothetical protein
MEVGFGQRIALVQIDGRLTADRVVRRYVTGRRSRRHTARIKTRTLVRTRLFDKEGIAT